jgi:hypothetical protein
MRRSRRAVILAAVFVAAVIACTDGGETYNFVTDCTEDFANDAGCEGGNLPYTCASGSLPSDTDPTLVCQGGSGVANGDITFCCISSTDVQEEAGPACTQDSDAGGCATGMTTFECPSSTTPQTSDPTLNCGQPTILSNGDVSYCCSN